MDEAVNLAAPLMQFGFAGFCAVLLAFIFWLVKRLLGVLDQTIGRRHHADSRQ